MSVVRKPMALVVSAFALLSLGASCDNVPEPERPKRESPEKSAPAESAPPARSTTAAAPTASGASSARETVTIGGSSCVVPLQEPPPPEAHPAAGCPRDPNGKPSMPPGSVTFLDAPSKPSIPVELATQPEHREHGLMFRTDLGADDGMLFSWDDAEQRTFWMHNTCLPLDMLFLGRDGTIVGILEQVPPMNDDVRTVPCPATHVLEVNAGWTRKHGVRPGQRVRIHASR